MRDSKIEELAYLIKDAKNNNKPNPIFFLGAGASKSGGVPLAGEIVRDILDKHKAHPLIRKLPEEKKTYAELMNCLPPHQRNSLLKKYIDDAKINVAHIYLAQMLTEGFVDYVLTVNFDNLMHRALALYNEYPATYDMAILKDLTTTTPKPKSVVHLHGQHHGLWLLNTENEMKKVDKTIPPILHSIKNERPWIFIGYSGNDPIFDKIKLLGRFDNGFYWVTYKDRPIENINVKEFLDGPDTNTSIIRGYDADTFMLKLNSALGLKQPSFIDKPFSSLQAVLKNIVDIDDEEDYKVVKERLQIAHKRVQSAIEQFEGINDIDSLKKRIIDIIINKDYEDDSLEEVIEEAKNFDNEELNATLANLYTGWGDFIADNANSKTPNEAVKLFKKAFERYELAIDLNPNYFLTYYNWGVTLYDLSNIIYGYENEELLQKAVEKYRRVIDLNPKYFLAYNNLGIILFDLARNKSNHEAEELLQQAIKNFRKASEINPEYHIALSNWGLALDHLSRIKPANEAEILIQKAIKKHQKAVEINPEYLNGYHNWGAALDHLARNKTGDERDQLFKMAAEKYQKTIEINPEYQNAYYNWGIALDNLARNKTGEERDQLFKMAAEKYQKTAELNPHDYEVYNSWGNALFYLGKTKSGQEAKKLFEGAQDKYKKVNELAGYSYNLARVYALLLNKKEALFFLEKSLEENQQTVSYVLNDENWKEYLEDEDFKKVIEKYSQ